MSQAASRTFSFNEVVTLATKAARGAGLGWGHAEDLGRAARWLAGHGLAWDVALCALLGGGDANVKISRLVEVADWAAYAGPGESRAFDGGSDAIWVLPLVSGASFGRSASFVVQWSGAMIHLFPEGGIASDRNLPRLAELTGTMTLEAVSDQPLLAGCLERLARPGSSSPAALARLSALADLTLVPASEASRARGAGSTQSDND